VSKRLQLESVVSVVVPEIADHNSPRGSSHLQKQKWSGKPKTKSLWGDGWLRGTAPACYSSSLALNLDISQKYKMGDISKGVANTGSGSHAKKYAKKQAKTKSFR
jgi:hypothetical protein